jgi:hypothetical protein
MSNTSATLAMNEKRAVRKFKKVLAHVEVEAETKDYAERIAKKAKRTQEEENGAKGCKHYKNLEYISPTSNIVERLFSRLKLILGDLRKSMLPIHLEATIFLMINRGLWDVHTIDIILNEESAGAKGNVNI